MWTKEELREAVKRHIREADDLLPVVEDLYDKVSNLQMKFSRTTQIAMSIRDPYFVGFIDTKVRECDEIRRSLDGIARCIELFIKEPPREERANDNRA
jgi:hypothetical protein